MRELKASLINPFSLVDDLLRNWWVILLSAVIGFSGFQVYNSAFVVEKYFLSTIIQCVQGVFLWHKSVFFVAGHRKTRTRNM